MILNIFKKLHDDAEQYKVEQIKSYDDQIRKSTAIENMINSAGYTYAKEVLNGLKESYKVSMFDESSNIETSKLNLAKLKALEEFEEELESAVNLGFEYKKLQRDLIENV